MLFRAVLAVLFCQTAFSLPRMDNGDALTGDNVRLTEELKNTIQKQEFGHLLNETDKLTILIKGNMEDVVTTDNETKLNNTVKESLLLHGQYSLGQVETMIRRTRAIFDEKLKNSKNREILLSDFKGKDGHLLTTDDDNEVKGQNSITVNYHHNPSLVQFYFFNKLPYEKRNLCDPNPCQNGGICSVDETKTTQDYYCKCPTPMGGKNCSDVDCGGEHCFHNGKTVIYVYNDSPVSWSEAKQKCEKKNMRLVKTPDEDSNEFVRRALLKMYANDRTSQHCYFNGLYRNTKHGNFHWTDGSPLGEYRPWSTGTLEGQCVVLCTTTKFYFYWDIDPCDGESNNWEYYYICERQLSFSGQ